MDIQALFFYITLGILILTAAVEFLFPQFLKRHASRILLYSMLIVGAYTIYIGFLQFQAFNSGILSSQLGTKSGFLWFLSYVQLHFWNQYLLSFLGGLLFFFIARYFNRKFGERFFWNEELYLASLGIFLVGYPGWFFYIILILGITLIGTIAVMRRGTRFPLYHVWIPAAIATHLLVGFWAVHQSWWSSFRF